ncbi:F-box domain-containing protein [Mycena venus]|uniref:F-box domain-containing protein n=1 Tax=Mycena venus TaxID=2733690 RepID=A0A8H6XMG3_9AGAR|nr:F-box domain-containing protein [Mycena venus]
MPTNHPKSLHNHHPPPSATASTLRHQLAAIDDKITCLEAQLTLLRSKRDVLSGALNSIVYPILTIPPELTTEIFGYYVHDNERSAPAMIRNSLTVASVCRAWRAIAISSGALWNNIESLLYFDRTNVDSSQKLLELCLSRSGNLPLDLDLTIWKSSESQSGLIMSLLTQYLSQCVNFRLLMDKTISFAVDHFREPLYSLKKLDIDRLWSRHIAQQTTITVFFDAPQLREAHIRCLSLPQISLPWIQLTNLHLRRQSLAQCFDILGQTPILEVLVIEPRLNSTDAQDPITAPPHVLSRLRSIKLRARGSDVFLQHLTLPILEHLSLCLSSEGVTRVKSLVARSRCSVRTLSLHDTRPFATNGCIRSLPSLRVLTLESLHWSSSEFDQFFDCMTKDRPVPALESLNLEVWYHPVIDVRSLADMLSARWTDMPGVTNIKSLSLSFDCDPKSYIFAEHGSSYNAQTVEDAVTRLRKMRREGLKIDIQSAPKWTTQYINSQMVSEIMNSP